MKILADANILFVKEAFSRFGSVCTVDSRDITRENCRDIDMLLVRSVTPVNRELLKGTSVKYVASATSGIDHVDLEYLQDKNIWFSHAPGSNANSVAEYVLAAVVHLAQKNELQFSTSTLGIIGAGNIGSIVLRLARAMNICCVLNDPPKKALTGDDSYLPLSTVLKESDIVTLHVPLNTTGQNATYHMVNAEFLSSMKKGAILINTSRGDVIDEPALKKGRPRLGGLVLDVWSGEPKPDTGTLALCDIATPHIAGYSYDGKVCGTEMIYNAVCTNFIKGKKWHAPPVSEWEKPKAIKIKKNTEPLAAAIMNAYPIMKDDLRFRKYLSIDDAKRGIFFHEIRSNYPQRFEFRNYTVEMDKTEHQATAVALSEIGFRTHLV
jgi:erythronate-4-phosphate dehydrogenase